MVKIRNICSWAKAGRGIKTKLKTPIAKGKTRRSDIEA
jgi:hypothetical protein